MKFHKLFDKIEPSNSILQNFSEVTQVGKAFHQHGCPQTLVQYGGGIGDDLLCTTVFHELRKRGKSRLWMSTNYPALFENNGDVDHVVPANNKWYVRIIKRSGRLSKKIGGQFVQPFYCQWIPDKDMDLPSDRHILTSMCQLSGITGTISRRPYLYLSESEHLQGYIAPKQIAIQSSGLSAKFHMTNKEWFPERFQAVVDALESQFTFVQVGSGTDPPLRGTIDLRGKTSLRETAAILSQSILFVGLEGLLTHLARSVECRSVIIYGGRSTPAMVGYSCNENITRTPSCSPCWLRNTCHQDHVCMDEIQPEEVTAAILRQAERVGQPLEIDEDFLV